MANKNNFKMGFVILHYCALKETVDCIESIIKFAGYENFQIIIVDNCSPNKSGIILKEMYKKNDKIVVLLNKENYGFAKGNNVGYLYAKEKLKCNFITIMNNDILLLKNNYCKKVYHEYEETQFSLMGPLIRLKNDKINKLYSILPTKQKLKTDLLFYRLELIKLKLHIKKSYNILRFIKKNNNHPIPNQKELNAFMRHEDIILHGSFLVFSPMYINLFDDAFDNRTFMFREEELLFIRCKNNNLKIVYNPDIEILHLEDIATNYIYNNDRRKQEFIINNQIKSIKILLKEVK